MNILALNLLKKVKFWCPFSGLGMRRENRPWAKGLNLDLIHQTFPFFIVTSSNFFCASCDWSDFFVLVKKTFFNNLNPCFQPYLLRCSGCKNCPKNTKKCFSLSRFAQSSWTCATEPTCLPHQGTYPSIPLSLFLKFLLLILFISSSFFISLFLSTSIFSFSRSLLIYMIFFPFWKF